MVKVSRREFMQKSLAAAGTARAALAGITPAIGRNSFGEEFWTPVDAIWDEERLTARILALSAWYARMGNHTEMARAASVYCSETFWKFLSSVAWSIDEKSTSYKVKPFLPLPYVKAVADFVTEQDREGRYVHPDISQVKSRQMLASWMAAQLMIWVSMQRPFSKAIIISSTEETGGRLLDRVKLGYHFLPSWFKRAKGLPQDASKIFDAKKAKFPNGSEIIVLPEKGGDKIRSLAPNLVILDEAGFQPDFEKSWTAVQGCTDSRCLVWAISTANAGFFQALTEDTFENVRGGNSRTIFAMQGLEAGQNQNNSVYTIRLHYTADPGKRSAEWKADAMAALAPYQWAQEFEMDFESRSGQPIFPMIDPTVHLTPKPLVLEKHGGRVYLRVPNPGEDYISPAMLALGIDHGRRNPCGAITLALDDENDLFAIEDYSVAGRTAGDNAREIKKALMGKSDVRDDILESDFEVEVIDAMMSFEGVRESDASRRTGLKVEDLYKYVDGDIDQPMLDGLKSCRKWRGSVQDGIDATCQLLHATLAIVGGTGHPYWERYGYVPSSVKKISEGRALFISPLCGALMRELKVARYKDKNDATINQPEVEVDRHNHVRKALAYILAERFMWMG